MTTGLLGREVIGWQPETLDKQFHEIIAHALNGTDVSGWQPSNPPLNGDAFSIIKASEGVGAPNGNWAAQVDWCRAAGALVGHYHFANGLNTATAEAEYFWSIVSTKWQTGEPLALDIEGPFFTNAAVDPVGWALAFAEVIFQLSGLKVLIYIDWQHEKAPQWNYQPLVDFNCGLWGAAYNPNGFGDPSPWPYVVIWQYADTNISGGDSDVLYGDAQTFRNYGTPEGVNVPLSQDDANLVADTILNRGIPWYGYNGQVPTSGRQSTSLGLTIGWIDTLFARVPDSVLNRPMPRQGTGASGTTSLGGVTAYFDANVAGLASNINGHTDAAVKGVSLNITDAQVQALADRLKADLPPAQIAALAAQLQKP